MPAGWGYLSCDSWQVSQGRPVWALFSSFCPCSWQEVQSPAASFAAAAPSSSRREPSRSPKKTARFVISKLPQNGGSGLDPCLVHEQPGDQDAVGQGHDGEGLAPPVDDVEF